MAKVTIKPPIKRRHTKTKPSQIINKHLARWGRIKERDERIKYFKSELIENKKTTGLLLENEPEKNSSYYKDYKKRILQLEKRTQLFEKLLDQNLLVQRKDYELIITDFKKVVGVSSIKEIGKIIERAKMN